MNIRDARESDLSSLAELLLVVHQLHVAAQPETYRAISHEAAVDFLAARFAEQNSFLRVAEADARLLGYYSAAIHTAPSIPLFQPRTFIYLNEVVVHPERRRSGIGRALIADLKALAAQADIEAIELDVRRFNAPAKVFFESQGFDLVREKLVTRLGTR